MNLITKLIRTFLITIDFVADGLKIQSVLDHFRKISKVTNEL